LSKEGSAIFILGGCRPAACAVLLKIVLVVVLVLVLDRKPVTNETSRLALGSEV